MKRHCLAPSLAAAFVTFAVIADLSAQCGHASIPGFPHLGPDGPVTAVSFCDPDGAGPGGVQLFVGGEFDVVENTPCAGVALYDLPTRAWSALPGGVFASVTAAGRDANGMLVVAGSYAVGPITLFRVASWTGTAWNVLGSSFDAPVLSIGSDGVDTIVGGEFTQNGGQALAGVARWSGGSWVAMGGGVARIGGVASVQAIADLQGAVVIGGAFDSAGGTPAANIAIWDGVAWQPLGAGLPVDVTSIATLSNGELFAAGLNTSAPIKWDGVSWQALPGLDAPSSGYPTPWVTALARGLSWNGEALFVAGNFDHNGFGADLAVWEPLYGWNYLLGSLGFDGSTGPTRLPFDALPVQSNLQPTMAVAGPFGDQAGLAFGGLTVVENFYAEPMGAGVRGDVLCSGALPNGDLLIGGNFTELASTFVAGLGRAHQDGIGWAAPTLGPFPALGGQWSGAEVRAIVPTRDGANLIVGTFTISGTAAGDIVRYDGVNWTTFGASQPFFGSAFTALDHSSGATYVGSNGLYRWSGGAWTLLSTVQSGYVGSVFTLAELPNGDVVVGGDLLAVGSTARPGLLRWSNNAWQPLGAGLSSVVSGADPLVLGSRVRDDGVLFVVGTAGGAPFVASFDGSNWQALPGPAAGTVRAIELLPDGDVVVGGQFASIGGVAAASLARWNGAAWSSVGDGVRMLDGTPGAVSSLCFSRNGELQITGSFARHDGEVSLGFTRVRSLCAAATQSFGSGCSGSGGVNQLRSQQAAWLGGTMRSVATGMPNGGIVVDVLGLAPTFAPLPTPGCALWVDPVALGLALPVAGRAELSLPIPAATSLIGQVLYQQAVGVELTGGAISGLTGSNRLQQTIGVF